MNLAKAMALLTLTTAFWLGVAHAQTHKVKGESPVTSRFFAKTLDCADATKDAKQKADKFCRKQGHRNADRNSMSIGGCWGLGKREVSVGFSCE